MENSTKLFTTEQIKRYFEAIEKKGRMVCNLYKGYDKRNPDYAPCEKDIFVQRTLNKWLSGKYLILYSKSDFGSEYKQYVFVSSVQFVYGYGNAVYVYICDYSNPKKGFYSIEIGNNEAHRLEGVWCENSDKHEELLKFFNIDIPEREFIFEAYDWNKYPKRVRNKDKALEKIKTTVSFKAKTEREAYKLMDKFREDKQNSQIMITSNFTVNG